MSCLSRRQRVARLEQNASEHRSSLVAVTAATRANSKLALCAGCESFSQERHTSAQIGSAHALQLVPAGRAPIALYDHVAIDCFRRSRWLPTQLDGRRIRVEKCALIVLDVHVSRICRMRTKRMKATQAQELCQTSSAPLIHVPST